MTTTEIQSVYKQSIAFLSQGNLKNAFDKIIELSDELQSPVHRENIENMQQSYRYMLQYFLKGMIDPERKLVYNKLIAKMFVQIADLREELFTRDSSNFEFSQKRYFPFTPQPTLSDLENGLNRMEKMALLHEAETVDTKHERGIQLEFETSIHFLFNYFWLKSRYDSPEILNLYRLAMDEANTDSVAKSMLVSALTLNLWRYFDETKLLMLLDACNTSDMYARERALAGLCFVLAKYNRFLPYFPAIRNRLVILADDNVITEQLQNIIIQIIATTETEQVSKKLQEEIFPELMKLRPLMDEGLNPENLMNLDEWGEINPQWEEMIEKSGASDKIQEFAELQLEGADVYMSTFAMLKSFPFFSEFSNWFMPFDTDNTAVKPLFATDDKSLMTVFLSSEVMCNSDRYSFCLSVLQMPELQRNLMKQSFGEATEQMEEISKDEALHSPNVQAKNISKHYIQDLFRFFRLNPHRSDFADMFTKSLIMHKTYLFDLLSIDDTLKTNIAEYYFTKKLYAQSLELFDEIKKEGEISAALYQKMGYAFQQTSRLTEALDSYKKADLIQPDDFWTNRKIGLCYRLMGNPEKALEVYRHTNFIKPDQLSVRLQIVNCLKELGKTEEALRELMQLNKQYPDNTKIFREIMHCSFIAKNMAQAKYFSTLLLETENLIPTDFCTAGHIEWCMNKQQKAAEYYIQSLRLLNNNWTQFDTLFQQDKNTLISNGIAESDLLLMLDGLKYEE